jgi:hypothetical protein
MLGSLGRSQFRQLGGRARSINIEEIRKVPQSVGLQKGSLAEHGDG